MAQTDLAFTDLLAHLCHLHPACLCPCERTVSSAWLQPLCGRTITGRARPPLAGRGVRRLYAVFVCCLLKLQPLLSPCKLLVSQCVCVCVCVWVVISNGKENLCGDWDKEFPLQACLDFCQPTHYSWSATNQTGQQEKPRHTLTKSLGPFLHVQAPNLTPFTKSRCKASAHWSNHNC